MTARNIETGVIYCADNLKQLVRLPTASVDLIYLDPPFFSNRNYEVIWGDEAEIRSFEDRWDRGIGYYIEWMRERAIEMRRVLRVTGSFYLHCDPHASHYLKVMLDDVFGPENFRNEIIWKRTGAHGGSQKYAPVHDVILYYGASSTTKWNGGYHEYSKEYLEGKYKYSDTIGRYRLITLFPSGIRNGETGKPWRGIDPTAKGVHWRYTPARLDELDREGMIYWGRSGKRLPQLKRYLDTAAGVPLQDIWTDRAPINSQARERLGYPTQKPEALLERIILASSDEGDVVLDPFCGCGTTVAVAQRLERRWIGIDISPTAVNVMSRRLYRATRGTFEPRIYGLPVTEEQLSLLKTFEFQNWVIQKLHGTGSSKKLRSTGIDAWSFMLRDPILISQSPQVSRPVIDSFEAAMRGAGKDIGYIVAFDFGKDALEEVARARWHDRLDIRLVTVHDLLNPSPDDRGSIFPEPATVDELPITPPRANEDKPTAEELVRSNRAV